MDVVEFRVEPESLAGGDPVPTVTPVVNGRRLQDHVRPLQLPHAEAEGRPQLAGRYAGLAIWSRLSASHYLGAPTETWFGDGDTILLGCVCGDAGCWPLTADVQVTSATVVWSNVRQGHRDWDLGALGPFTFDRHDYEAALATALPT